MDDPVRPRAEDLLKSLSVDRRVDHCQALHPVIVLLERAVPPHLVVLPYDQLPLLRRPKEQVRVTGGIQI